MLLACPSTWYRSLNHFGPLGVNSLIVPVGVSSYQRTSQRAVRLRFRVARGARAFSSFVIRSSTPGLLSHHREVLLRGADLIYAIE